MLAESVLIERVERTDATVVNLDQQTGFMLRYDLYVMSVNREKNCYNCKGFRYIARNCRNQERIGQGRRLESGKI